MHVLVCTHTGVFDISVHVYKHTLRTAFTCTRVCAVCLLGLGDEGKGVQTGGHFLLAWNLTFDMRKMISWRVNSSLDRNAETLT